MGLRVGVDSDDAGRRCATAPPSRSPPRRPCRARGGRAPGRRSTRRRPDGAGTSSSRPERRGACARRSAPAAARRAAGCAGGRGPLDTADRVMSRRDAGAPDAPRRSGTSTPATTTSRPPAMTPSGASTSARSARRRCWASSARCSGRELERGFERSLEIGAGTGYFSLNLLQAGVVKRGDLHRHLPRDGAHAGRQRRAAGARGAAPPAPTPSRCRSPTGASTWCSATPFCITCPTWSGRSPSFTACSRPGAGSCSPASRRASGDRLAACAQARRGRAGPAVATRSCAPPRAPAADRGRRRR